MSGVPEIRDATDRVRLKATEISRHCYIVAKQPILVLVAMTVFLLFVAFAYLAVSKVR